MKYIDLKYIKLASSRLSHFKEIGQHRFRFRCPYCGDSHKSETKVRGNIFPVGDSLIYKCFNCSISTSIQALLDRIDPSLKRDYMMETLGGLRAETHTPIFLKEKSKPLTDAVLDELTPLNELDRDHPAYRYIKSRLIPVDLFERIYYTDTFKAYVNSVIPNKFKHPEIDHARIVLPYFNPHGKCYGVIGRTLIADDDIKYLTIKFDDSYDMVYGLDTVNYGRRVYVVEGPIDSLFLPNCLAASGTGFDSATIQRVKANSTIVIDNEPRNKEIVKIVEALIEKGYNVCLLPETYKFKDINAGIIGGYSSDKILNIIDSNTFYGLKAKLHFTSWRKT